MPEELPLEDLDRLVLDVPEDEEEVLGERSPCLRRRRERDEVGLRGGVAEVEVLGE